MLKIMLCVALSSCDKPRENQGHGNGSQFENAKASANEGDAEAQFDLANHYYNGDGVPQDYSMARKWYKLAAEQNHAEASYALGVIYKQGKGGIEDKKKSLKYYTLAAKKGNANAQLELGKWYYVGYNKDVGKSFIAAYMFFNLAAANNEKDEVPALRDVRNEAEKWKRMLEKKMTSEQIAEAQSWSTEWHEDASGSSR